MVYEVRIIGKLDLPPRQDWALVEVDGRRILLVKEGKYDAALLAEVWAAGRKIRRRSVPAPRPALALA